MKVSSIGYVRFYYPFQHVLYPSSGNRWYSQNILICSGCQVGLRYTNSMLFISLFAHWSKEQHWSTAETFLMHAVIRLCEPCRSWEDLLPTAVTDGYVGTKCVNWKIFWFKFGSNFCFREHPAVYLQLFCSDIEFIWKSQRAEQTKAYLEHQASTDRH